MIERAREIDRLLEAALEAPDREAFLAGCGELGAEVARLLEAHDRMGDFLGTPAARRWRDEPLPTGHRVGRYTIRRVLAKGGGGVVYEAEQESPRRTVALKVLARGGSRWLEEAEILARLRHPDIAIVHEAGETDGVPWIAMELVDGPPLTRALDGRGEDERLAVFVRVCEAVHHGHLAGIVHRDLKPANILVLPSGPKVIDFGIAAVQGEISDHVSGTLSYMSPEQLEPGARIDARSDVYSLGVVLSEILTGRVPVDLAGRRFDEARAILARARPPEGRGDLAAIVRRALADAPEERYESAAALAEDVRRYLRREPVRARPASPFHALALFVRRRTAVAASLGTILVLLVAGAAVSLDFAVRAERDRKAALVARDEADLRAYVANLAVAQAALDRHDVEEARRRLDAAPARLRGWEWRHLASRLDRSVRSVPARDGWLGCGALTADGRFVVGAVSEPRSVVTVFDAATGEARSTFPVTDRYVLCLAVDPASRWIAVGTRAGVVEIRAFPDGRLLRSVPAHASFVNEVAFDRSGGLVASAGRDGLVHVFDPATGESRRRLRGHTDRAICVAFGPSGRVVSGGREGEIRVWEGEETIAVLRGHTGSVEGVALSPDGRRLASVSRDRTVRLWDLDSMTEIAAGRGHVDNVRAVAFDPGGRFVATASYDHTARIWAASDLDPLACLDGHTQLLRDVAFGPGGREIVTIGNDGFRFWDSGCRAEPLRITVPVDQVNSLAFDGETIRAGTQDGRVRSYDPASGRAGPAADLEEPVRWLAPAGDGVLVTGEARAVLFLGPERVGAGAEFGVGNRGRAWDPARSRLWSGSVRSLRAVGPGGGDDPEVAVPSPVLQLAFDPVHRRLAVADEDAELRIRDGDAPDRVRASVRLPGPATALEFSPDGTVLAVGDAEGGIALFDARDLSLRFRRQGHSDTVTSLSFHPEGRRFASASNDRTVGIWDPRSGTEVLVLRTGEFLRTVRFSPDGRRLAAGGGSLDTPGSILVWSVP